MSETRYDNAEAWMETMMAHHRSQNQFMQNVCQLLRMVELARKEGGTILLQGD